MASTVDGYIGKINPGDGINYAIGSTAYGRCTTDASVSAKTVDMVGFQLIIGATIHVKFTNTNTASNPSLNVNNTGAKPLYLYEGTRAGTTESTSWFPGETVSLTYDGTNWLLNDYQAGSSESGLPTGGSAGYQLIKKSAADMDVGWATSYGVCSTAASTAAKTVTISGFTLGTGVIIRVKFDNGNTAANPTLNVNDTGAKSIYLATNGTQFVVNEPFPASTIENGDIVELVYNGSAWVVTNTTGYRAFYSSLAYAECSTEASTVAKAISISGFKLRVGATVHIKFTYANTADEPTLSLNGGIGKPLYLYGTTRVGTTPNTSWHDGQVVSFTYNGTAWYMNDYRTNGILIYDIASFSSLPQTVTDSLITADHVLLRSELGTPTAQASNWTVTTAAGSLTVSGTMTSSSSTTIRLVLGIPANPPAST